MSCNFYYFAQIIHVRRLQSTKPEPPFALSDKALFPFCFMKRMSPPPVFPHARRRGFALVISLGLMGLMVLLALSLSALIQVESHQSNISLNRALAQQYALVGACQALGVLQSAAGPDNRVTARADINSANTANPYWTGVWNSASVSATQPLCWLVSAPATGTPSPAVALSESARVTLCRSVSISNGVATGSLANPVTAARLAVNAADKKNGGYAWWVSDEGVKASVALRDEAAVAPEDDEIINSLTKDERKKNRSLYRHRSIPEVLSSAPESYLLSDDNQNVLDKLSTPSQLSYLDEARFPKGQTISQALHDLTGISYGVLAHTLPNLTPSLKIDLSTQLGVVFGTDYWKYDTSTRMWTPARGASQWNAQLPAQWDQWGAPLSAFLNAWRAERSTAFTGRTVPATSGLSRLPLVGPIPASPSTGKPCFSILPVLSEFSIHYAPYFRGESFHTGNLAPTSALAAALIAEGSLTVSTQTINVSGVTRNYYIANRSAIERIAQDPAMRGKGVIPGNIFYRVTGFFELWNPYTAEIAFPRQSAGATATVAGCLRAEITGLPTHRLTYWRDRSVGNYNPSSMALEKDDTWSGANADMTGQSKPLNLQEKLGKGGASNPFCVNLPLPSRVTISGGSLQPWTGFAAIGGSIYSSGWGIKEGLTTFYSTAQNTFREAGSVHNLFAAYPFITGALSFAPDVGLAPVVASDDGGTPTLSTQQMTVRNMYVQVQDADGPPTYRISLRWIANNTAGADSGVEIGAYRMPTPESPLNFGGDMETARKVNWLPGFDGENVDCYRLQSLISRFGYFFARKDAALTDFSDTANSWWLSALPDPRSIRQEGTGKNNPFLLMRPPEEVYAFFSEATDVLKTTLLERPAGATRARKSSPRDEMIDTYKNDRAHAGIVEEMVAYQKDPDANFTQIFPDESRRPLEDLSTKVPLFEIPTTRPISLGVLQHMAIEGVRPFSIGNSWGQTVSVSGTLSANAVFDVYTLTGLDSTQLSALTELRKGLPNPNLLPLWTDTLSPPVVTGSSPYTSIAANFLTRGAFNVNSTSVLAWKSVLAGIWLDGTSQENQWEYLNVDPITGLSDNAAKSQGLRRSFYRFPHSAHETFVAPSPDEAQANGLAHHNQPSNEMQDSMGYRRGVRTLTDRQIDAMAVSIVESIRRRGRPFTSMQAFLAPEGGESVIEKAIRVAGVNDDAAWDPEGKAQNKPHPYAAAFLTQADILNTLAPQLQARSDTFKIRGYGDVREADGSVAAAAICELTVQRMPETVRADDDITAPSGPLGRKFKVISLRWINE